MSKLLIAIKSCHKHADRRAAQQATWLRDVQAHYVFLIGNPIKTDIFDSLMCPVSDEFKDIAPKVHYASSYALQNNFDHMAVLDDDTYARPERLFSCGFEKHDYMGFMRTAGLAYNNDIPYAQGSCFFLSARAMESIVTSPVMKPGIIDDGAVGQALDGKVAFTHDRRFYPGPVPDVRPEPRNFIISTHKCLPEMMHVVHTPWIKK